MKWFRQGYVNEETTCFLWWIEDRLPFVDEEGEPVVRDYEKEEIHEEIQRFVTIFLTQGMEEGTATHCITDGHERFPHPMDYSVQYRWWPVDKGGGSCLNCGTNFADCDPDLHMRYIEEDDERYTEENDGVLCVFCEEVDA